jgi:hypothetical protein
MIVVRHLTGPRAGTVDRLDARLNRIVFGRRESCDVVFPPEETIIAREHFALMRKPPGPAGHWTIELFGEPFVAVNGVGADPGQGLPPDATFELGRYGGPSFTVHVEPDPAADNLPLTETQEKEEGARFAAASARSAAAVARRIAVVGIAAAIVAAGAAGYFYWNAPRQGGIGDAVRANLLRAAFLVEAPAGNPEATAFPIGPYMLATNSHVGELLAKLHPGQQMTVRSPGQNGRIYHVTAAKLHPGYKAFSTFLAQDVLRSKFAQIGVPGYDVAILTVEERLPADAILQPATTDELRALKPGVELATAGYPCEGVVGCNAQGYGATPEYHTGTVTSLTDFFFLPADFAHSQLIHDSVPAAGGASGSPIVDAGGHVVALLSAGNSYTPAKDQPRIPSGVLINYAQRVDLLRQLLTGDADRRIAAEQKYWTQEFGVFASGIDVVDRVVASKLADADRGRNLAMVRVSATTGRLLRAARVVTATGETQRQIEIPVEVAAGTEYVFIAYAHNGSPLQLWVYDGDKPLVHAGAPSDATSGTFAPWLRFKAPGDARLGVWLVSPDDRDMTYSFQVYRLQSKTALDQTKPKGASG